LVNPTNQHVCAIAVQNGSGCPKWNEDDAGTDGHIHGAPNAGTNERVLEMSELEVYLESSAHDSAKPKDDREYDNCERFPIHDPTTKYQNAICK